MISKQGNISKVAIWKQAPITYIFKTQNYNLYISFKGTPTNSKRWCHSLRYKVEWNSFALMVQCCPWLTFRNAWIIIFCWLAWWLPTVIQQNKYLLSNSVETISQNYLGSYQYYLTFDSLKFMSSWRYKLKTEFCPLNSTTSHRSLEVMTVAFFPQLVSQAVGGNGPGLEGSILEETLQPNPRLTAKSTGRENNGGLPRWY